MPTSKPLAENEHLFTSESVTEGHPDKVSDQISDGVLDAIMARGPRGPRRLRDARQHRHGRGLRRDHDRRPPRHPRDRPRDGPRDRLRPRRATATTATTSRSSSRSTSSRPDIAQGVDVAYETRVDDADDDDADRRRRRPGNDVRLRQRRDRGADADADPPRPPARRAPRRGAQGRHARLPRPRRQDPGQRPLPRRPPGRDRQAADLHPARRGRRLAGDDPARPLGARGAAGAARPRFPACTTRPTCARASWSTRPASS